MADENMTATPTANYFDAITDKIIDTVGISHIPFFQEQFVQAFIFLVLFYLISRIALWFFEVVLLKIAMKTRTTLDDMIVHRLKGPLSWLLLLIGIKLAVKSLNMNPALYVPLNRIVDSLMIIGIVFAITKLINTILKHWGESWSQKTNSSIDDDLIPLIRKTINVVSVIISIIYILVIWGIEVGPFIASLGIAGIAIGFAVQDSLKNIFGGISLILDKSFKVGDAIELDGGTSGTVLDVGIRSTKIKNWDSEILIIPNGELANARIINWAKPELQARAKLNFGVQYGSDIEKVRKLVLGIIDNMDQILKEPAPYVRFDALGESSLNFIVYFWVSDYSTRFRLKDELLTNIYNALNKEKIGIPFPTRTVYLHKTK